MTSKAAASILERGTGHEADSSKGSDTLPSLCPFVTTRLASGGGGCCPVPLWVLLLTPSDQLRPADIRGSGFWAAWI